MFGKSSAALFLAVILGAAAPAQSAQDRWEDQRGGFVIPGNTVGVNPAYHPGYAHCIQRFRTYDHWTGTYLGSDGRRHPCQEFRAPPAGTWWWQW
jgi:hypothetical protein